MALPTITFLVRDLLSKLTYRLLYVKRSLFYSINIYTNRRLGPEENGKLLDQNHRRRYRTPKNCTIVTLLLFVITLLFRHLCATYCHQTSFSKPFSVTRGRHPVLSSGAVHHFANTPISEYRPKNQFTNSDTHVAAVLGSLMEIHPTIPLLTIITVTRNPRSVFLDTATFIQEQSLRHINWIIVNDNTDSVESYDMLKGVRAKDPRVTLLNNSASAGFSSGRMFALDSMRKKMTKYFTFLDDDDLFELTAYEKCLWMLESNKNVSMCGSYVVGFGEKNYTWTRSFHNRASIYMDTNPLTGSEMIRSELLSSTGCRFSKSLETGMEDWDFFLCVASHGEWGATIPEFLFWYRQNPISFRKQRWAALFEENENTTQSIRSRYASLEHTFPPIRTHPVEVFERIPTTLPFTNHLNLEKAVILIIPWMTTGGADRYNIDLVRELSRLGFRVTIVCTMLDMHANSMASRPYFMQFTHDIFSIPAMIRLSDAPRFLSYLIESRNARLVLVSNSELGYGLLPWLSARHEHVRFVDYVHNEEVAWKNGGYAAFSTIHRGSLDCTFTSSISTRKFMIDNGHSPKLVEVGYLGIDVQRFRPFREKERTRLRAKYGLAEDAIVIIYLSRMVDYKRPKVVLNAFLNVVARERARLGPSRQAEAYRLTLLLIGDGPRLAEVEALAKDADATIKVQGVVSSREAKEYVAISDIFCLPSLSEGISFTAAEAMSLGVAPLVSNFGGFPELIGQNGVNGVIVNCTGEEEEDTRRFAVKMYNLAMNAGLRKGIGARAMFRVQGKFDSTKRIPELVQRILKVPLRRMIVDGASQDVAPLYYTQENVLEEYRVHSDFHETQKALQGKKRGEYGTRYRATCGEYSEIMTKLIDFLEEAKACSNSAAFEEKVVREFALAQCGQWCIMNLKDESRNSGWLVSEGCKGLIAFDDEKHECANWYKSRRE